jgi:hypothetical protein
MVVAMNTIGGTDLVDHPRRDLRRRRSSTSTVSVGPRIERGADRGKHFLDVTNVCVFLLGLFGGERD